MTCAECGRLGYPAAAEGPDRPPIAQSVHFRWDGRRICRSCVARLIDKALEPCIHGRALGVFCWACYLFRARTA